MYFSTDGVQIFYEQQGNGFPVVLLHPFPVNHNFWSAIVPRLAERYRVVAPDLRGHGASGITSGPITMQQHARDLLQLCDELKIKQAIFVGASIGGYLLFEFWRRHRERVRALALCVTKAEADSPEARSARLASAEEVERSGPQGFIDGMIPKLIGGSTRRNHPDLVETARSMMEQMKPPGIAAIQRGMAARPDSTLTLGSIDVPTLVIAGAEDTLVPAALMETMSRKIPGSRFQTVSAAGHYAPFEQPQEMLSVLWPFLESLRF